jgi:mannitol/fructose-specific phosphotransferase system IIA component (Ntr-type)
MRRQFTQHTPKTARNRGSMNISKFIAKSCIVAELGAKNKSDALKELTHLLYEKKRMSNVGPALDQIVAREATESTGLGGGIAVPHARIPGMKNLSCAVGRISEGMDFMAVDRKPVQIIFLICYPPAQQTTYLNFVATLARLLSDKDNMAAVMGAKTEEDISEVLENASKNFAEAHEQAVRKVKTDPAISKMKDSHADLIVLARLQLHQEMMETAKSGKTRIKTRIEDMRGLVDPRILKHYDKLTKGRAPALVPVEGDTCQGCFIRLPTKFVQQVRQDMEHIHTCTNCSRYIYVV